MQRGLRRLRTGEDNALCGARTRCAETALTPRLGARLTAGTCRTEDNGRICLAFFNPVHDISIFDLFHSRVLV